MNPRRVIHVLDTAAPRGAAICGMVENLATGVDPDRYQIQVCFLEEGPLQERLRRAGIECGCVHWNGSARTPRGAMRYAVLLRSANFSVIHQHTGGRFLTAMGRWLTHASIVRHLHFRAAEGTGIVPPHLDLPERDALIAVSQCVADFSQDPRAVVIHPGIDASPFSEPRTAHQGVVIGTACRLEPVKGLSHLLEAMAVLAPEFDDLRLEIAGDGSLRAPLEGETRKLGISSRVTFLGWRNDLASLMAGWDIFVMPSLDESFNVAVLEAMAAGLPVVASAVGGLRELVLEGKTGLLVPAASPAELALALRRLIQNSGASEAMGVAGRHRALRDFPVPRMVEQTVAVYDKLLADRPADSGSK